MTTMTASNWTPSPAQIELMRTVFAERVGNDVPNRQQWWDNIKGVSTLGAFQSVLADLKGRPKVGAVPFRCSAPHRTQLVGHQGGHTVATQQVAHEVGLYRNPATGELYRITKPSWELIVAKYTQTGGPRRLLSDGETVVKGSFKRLNSWDSRRALKTIDKAWKIDPKDLARDYAYGFCPLHFGPLTDAVSVTLGYGPDCAKREGLPWGEDEMNRVIAARKAGKS